MSKTISLAGLTGLIGRGALVAALAFGTAHAVRPDDKGGASLSEDKGNPFRGGLRKLRRLTEQDLLEQGETLRRDRVALRGDAGTALLRRLNARLASAGGEVRIVRVQEDPKGNAHIRLQQYHQGHPVVGSDMVVHVNAANEIYGVGGSLAQGLSAKGTAALRADQARAQARSRMGLKEGAVEKQAPALVVFNDVLAYQVLIEEPGDKPALWRAWVDAETGEVLHKENRILHGAPVGGAAQNVTGARLAGEGGETVTINGWRDNLNLFFLHNATNRWGVYDQDRFDWSQNTTGDWAATDRAAVSLARNMELTQQYVSTVLNRNSYDGAGAFANLYVHEGTNYVNAYWDGAGLHFGDGDGVEAAPLTVLDVAAHEFGHAITEYTSGLVYSYESGALNESYSDILGALVEFWAQPDGRPSYPAGQDGRADYLMGEDCWLSDEALRDLRNPGRFGQPSYYGGTNWFTGSGDNGGVHYNSGVQNFAFYLLAEGGAGSNDGRAYNVTGLGIQAAGEIAMYANMFLLTSNSQYRDAREAWILAATTLGHNVQTVRDVWTACGVLEQVNNLAVNPSSLAFGNVGAGSTVILNLALSNNGSMATTVSALSFNHAAFASTAVLPLTVAGGSTVQLPVRFTPPAIGTFPGQLTITSNADDNPSLAVSLSGAGTPPSQIEINPTEIQATVNAGENATGSLAIRNTGGADLTFTIEGAEGGRILINEFCNNPDFIELWNRGSDRNIGGWRLSWVDDAGSAVLSFTFPSGYVLRAGRRVVVREATGTPNDSTFYAGANIGWIEGSAVAVSLADAAGAGIDFVRTTNSTQLPPAGTSWSGTGVAFSLFSAYRNQNEDTDSPVGWASSSTFTEFFLNPGQTNTGSFPSWLSMTPVSGTVTAGMSQNIAWTLNSAGLFGGVHNATVVVRSNDPAAPNGTPVAVRFTVQGVSRLAVTPSNLVFGNVWQGVTRRLDIMLTNSGNEATTITALDSDNPRFTTNATLPLVVDPFDTVRVEVAFAPTALGNQDGLITIQSDAEDFPFLGVVLSGNGTAPPVSALAPTSLEFDLAPSDAPADLTSTLSNAGGDVLEYQIASVAQTGSPQGMALSFKASRSPAAPDVDRIYAAANYLQPHVQGEVIVALKEGRSNFASSSLLASVGTREVKELALARDPKTGLRSHGGRKVLLVQLKGEAIASAIATLRDDDNVAYVEPNYVRSLVAIPNDASFTNLYGMHNTGQLGGRVDADVDAPEAWDRHTGNRTMVLGVIDTGIDYLHPDLAANMWTNAAEQAGAPGVDDDGNGYVDDVYGYDFINNDGNPMDDHYHGTHCAGTIAGVGNNGVGVAGVAWTASMAALKIFNSGGSTTDAAILNAVDYSNAMGMKITSNSWGGGPYSQSLHDLIAEGRDLGHLFIAAAGNNAANNDLTTRYPSGYNLENIIAVAATDRFDNLASFSNYGAQSVDLAAPGVDTYSCQPGNRYQNLSGTSMATPHVSGAAYLLWTANSFLTAAQVKTILLGSVDPVAALAGRTLTGGRLNVAQALADAGPSWLTAGPMAAGQLAPGASVPLHVTVNPAGMVAGTWTGRVTVATNDPATPQRSIDVTARISGCKSLAVTPGSVDFGTRFTGSVGQAVLTLRNDCNDTTVVTSVSSSHADFSLAAVLPVRVPPFGTVAVNAEFRPVAAGIASGTLSLSTDADTDPVKTVAVTGTGVVAPHAVVTPSPIARTVLTGRTMAMDLDIGNTGGSLLTWQLNNVDQGLAQAAPYDASHFVELGKGEEDTRVGRPVTQASGGPDTFGYRWIDSDSPNGPAFVWQDISATGASVAAGCDDCFTTRTLSFPFPFYGGNFSSVNITSNGWVNFGSASAQYSNSPLPTTSMPINLVAGFFDDLSTSVGRVYFQDFGNRAIIQYQDVRRLSNDGTVTFQIVLHADGGINLYYHTVTGNLLSATTGIQNGTGTVGLNIQYNTAYVKNNLAVSISTLPEWLRVSALSGSVEAGLSQTLTLTLDASHLPAGVYNQVMTLTHNNPLEAPVQVPVTLTVVATAASRVLRIGPSALAAAAGSRHFLWNLTVGGDMRGLARGSRYTLYLK